MIVILDRDGVINYESEKYIKTPDEWIPIPNSLEAIAQLNRNGWKVIIATNQSGLARGFYNEKTLHQIHQKMLNHLAAVGGHIDAIYFCPHHPDDHCLCRKPQPGMLHKISEDFAINLKEDTIVIGDSARDIQAGQIAGCQTILVKTGNGKKAMTELNLKGLKVFDNLSAAAEFLITTYEFSY